MTALAASLRRLLDDPDGAAELGRRARARCEQHYSFAAARAALYPAGRAGGGGALKILVVSRPFVFHGGVERATAGFLQALVAHGHDVHLLSPPGQQPLAGVTLHTLALPPVPRLLRVLVLPLATRLAVRRRAWDAVQSHERTLDQDVYRAGEGCHRAYLDALGGPPRRRVAYHRLLLALERRVFTRTPEIVGDLAPGAPERSRALYGVPPARLSVVYNGVDLGRFHPDHRARDRAAARAEAGMPATAWAALFVGQRVRAQGAGHRAARRWRRWATAPAGCWSSARATRSRTGSWPSASAWASGWRGSAPGPTSSAGTRRRTRWCCRRATSRSATCTWRRSPRGCRW